MVTGMQSPGELDRLVRRPTFILSSIRSGSTLLRCLLNSHPMICAPHELHLGHVAVTVDTDYASLGMSLLGYSTADLQRLLWDRILHTVLAASGKAVIVDKRQAMCGSTLSCGRAGRTRGSWCCAGIPPISRPPPCAPTTAGTWPWRSIW
jgi:hypothetical protein